MHLDALDDKNTAEAFETIGLVQTFKHILPGVVPYRNLIAADSFFIPNPIQGKRLQEIQVHRLQ